LAIVSGDLGIDPDREDEQLTEVEEEFDLEMVAEDVNRPEVVGVGSTGSFGELSDGYEALLWLH
jgi:hypothetical protein